MSANYIRKTGAFLATNAAISLGGDKVGFKPSYVKITNEANGAYLEWYDSMGPDTGMLDDGAGGSRTFLSADGLTPTSAGFDLAAGIAEINDNAGEMLHFFALG